MLRTIRWTVYLVMLALVVAVILLAGRRGR